MDRSTLLQLPFNHYIHDDDFHNAIHANDMLFNMNNNPLFTLLNNANDTESNTILDEIDPDGNFFNSLERNGLCDSNYYVEQSFNNKFGNYTNSSQISMFHLNVRSIVSNFRQLDLLLSSLQTEFDVIGLSETWLTKSNTDIYNFTNYNHIYKTRNNKRGGGVSMYIKKCYKHNLRDDLSILENHCESIFTEIETDVLGKQTIVFGVVYRPPNTPLNSFLEYIDNVLEIVKKEKKICYLLGDFNIDLLKQNEHPETNEFLDKMYTNSFLPCITKPTRATSNTSTLIDNIFSNMQNLDYTYTSGLIYTDITDHFPIFHMITNKKNTMPAQYETIRKRQFTSQNKDNFYNKLNTTSWDEILNTQQCQTSYSIFLEKIQKIYDKCFPYVNIKINKKRNKPWVTKAIKRSINVKNKLYQKSIKHPNDENKKLYKLYKNNLSKLLKKSEKNYYKELITKSQTKLKTTWKIINNIITKNKSNQINNQQIKLGNNITSDPQEIASAFNQYFAHIGPSLANKIKQTTHSHTQYLEHNNLTSFYVTPTTQNEITSTIKQLNNSNSKGWDDLCCDIIINIGHLIAKPLSHIINLSFSNGIVPWELKRAKVTAIFKNGDNTNINNYRPISILPFFSKVFEKTMYKRLVSFLDKYKILHENQFGFRKNYSTALAATALIDNIVNSIENKEITVGIFIDLSKAFDTVNHTILLDKLKSYGIRGTPLLWFKSYLTNRDQYVNYKNKTSNTLPITCGVPQGSILGSLLFILYINDLPRVSSIIKFIMFADDTSLLISGKDEYILQNTVNNELKKVANWLDANKLSLNINKTNFITFKSRNKKINYDNLNIMIKQTPIFRVNETKFLGITIDQFVTFKTHILNISNKLSKTIGILYKCRDVITKSSLIQLYYAIAHPYLSYCNLVWACNYETNLSRLNILQNKIIRVIFKLKKRDSAKPYLSLNRIPNVQQINSIQTAITIHKVLNTDSHVLRNIFTYNNANTYNTRQQNHITVPIHRTNIKKHTLSCNGPRIWNTLTHYIQTINSPYAFKKTVKKYVLCL